MNFKNKLAVALFAVTTGVFGLASGAFAGEGAAAGAASFSTDSLGNVTGGAVSAAVGKNNAAASATNTTSFGNTANTASSLGSAGFVNVSTFSGSVFGGTTTNISGGTDADLATPQANTLSGGATAITTGAVAVGQ